MEISPESDEPVEDNEESDAFLREIVIESINDAILLMRDLRATCPGAISLLEQAIVELAKARSAAAAEDNGPTSDDRARSSRLSPTAIDLIVERRLGDLDAEARRCRKRSKASYLTEPSAAVVRMRQQIIMLMIEALSLMEKIDDDDAIAHLQLAIDRSMRYQAGNLAPDRSGTEEKSRPH